MSEKNVSTLFYNMLKKKPPTSDNPWRAAPYMINIAIARVEYKTYIATDIKLLSIAPALWHSFLFCLKDIYPRRRGSLPLIRMLT